MDSKTHAAPGVTMSEYGKLIRDGLLNAPFDNVKGIVEAYGISHKAVIDELIQISDGQLKKYLDQRINDWRSRQSNLLAGLQGRVSCRGRPPHREL